MVKRDTEIFNTGPFDYLRTPRLPHDNPGQSGGVPLKSVKKCQEVTRSVMKCQEASRDYFFVFFTVFIVYLHFIKLN